MTRLDDFTRVQMEAAIASITRVLAREEIKQQWSEKGKRNWGPVELANAITAHLDKHKPRLRCEAKGILSANI